MERRTKLKLAAGVAAVLAVAGGGAAIAATGLGSPKEQSQAIVDDAAKQLGIEPGKLSAAIQKAMENQVDAAVAAGRLTKEQGDALKARIASGDYPLFGGLRGGPGHFGHGGRGFVEMIGLGPAATYLGLTKEELHTALKNGKTLAQLAADKGKSVDGLVTVIVNAKKKALDDAVAAGRLTDAQRTAMLDGLEARVRAIVNGEHAKLPGHRFGFGGGPPGFGRGFQGSRPSAFRSVA